MALTGLALPAGFGSLGKRLSCCGPLDFGFPILDCGLAWILTSAPGNLICHRALKLAESAFGNWVSLPKGAI
jgi:hypothetical protein